jgi:hypothetical protein
MNLLDDDETFNSIMSSNYRFKFKIFKAGNIKLYTELQADRLRQIIEKIGKSVKEFHMNYRLPANIIQLLSIMPNLKIVELWHIKNFASEFFVKGKLELHKLQRIKCYNVSPPNIEIFDQLPLGVLEEIEVQSYESEDLNGRILFPNQHNIKKVTTDKKFIDFIDWKSLKLKSLIFNYFEDCDHVLTGQNQIETFKSNFMNQSSVNAICNELTLLVDLDIGHLRVDRDEPENYELWKLRNLKNLRIGVNYGTEIEHNFLNLIRSDSVEKLTISVEINEWTVKQLAVNFPRLTYFRISCYSSFNFVNAIIKNLPNLEYLRLFTSNDDTFFFQNGLKHNNLKSLNLDLKNTDDIELPKLINCCEKLEELEITSWNIKFSLLEQIKVPKLKSLKLQLNYDPAKRGFFELIDLKIVADFKKYCKKLSVFNFTFCANGDSVKLEMIEKEFKEIFSKVKVTKFPFVSVCL